MSGTPPLVHHDIKSQVGSSDIYKVTFFARIGLNILLDACLSAKLGDFGFAMDMPKHSSGRTLVSAPHFARTDGYFALELIGRKVSSKSNVYSFGVVSLRMLIGNNQILWPGLLQYHNRRLSLA